MEKVRQVYRRCCASAVRAWHGEARRSALRACQMSACVVCDVGVRVDALTARAANVQQRVRCAQECRAEEAVSAERVRDARNILSAYMRARRAADVAMPDDIVVHVTRWHTLQALIHIRHACDVFADILPLSCPLLLHADAMPTFAGWIFHYFAFSPCFAATCYAICRC